MNGWTLGTDGSHWSGYINFKKMRSAGARFYVGKASDSFRGSGKFFEDTMFKTHFTKSFHDGEILNGCFHWLQPDADPYKAADFYIERYRSFPFQIQPVLDFEETYAYRKVVSRDPLVYAPTGLESHYCWCAQVWLERVHAATGRKPIVYTAKWFTDNFKQKHLEFLGAYDLWVAQYPHFMFPWTRPRLPYPWSNWKIWQYSADGNGRGAEFGVDAKSIDLNYFQGDYDQFLEWLGEPNSVENGDKKVNVIEMLGNMVIRDTSNVGGDALGYALRGEVFHSTQEQNGWHMIEKAGIGQGWISGLTQWTRITKVDNPEPEPQPEKTVDERLTSLEDRVEKIENIIKE